VERGAMTRASLSLIIPFRDDDGTRTAVKEWIVARWRHHHPDAEIIVGSDDGGTPFSKTLAVNRAFDRSSGDIVGMLDSDVWIAPEHTREAVDLIARGAARWVKPASKVFRLTEAATARLVAQDPRVPFPKPSRDDYESIRKIWGLFHLFPRAAFEAIGGYDPRFRGWGGEDTAAIAAMDTLWGEHTMLPHSLYHLYHPHATNAAGEAIWEGQTARNTDLRDRYDAARGKPELMRVLAEETRALRFAQRDEGTSARP
jgi:hypothetical protein